MRQAAAAFLVLSFGTGACASAASAEKLRKLSSPQIRAKFSGMQFTDGVHWGEVYAPNGTLTSTEMGKKRIGHWRVEHDQLCTELGREGGTNCYEVWTAGTKVELRLPGVEDAALEGVLEKPPTKP